MVQLFDSLLSSVHHDLVQPLVLVRNEPLRHFPLAVVFDFGVGRIDGRLLARFDGHLLFHLFSQRLLIQVLQPLLLLILLLLLLFLLLLFFQFKLFHTFARLFSSEATECRWRQGQDK
uniref:Uncharacterized protein n=1 Tax=Cacopsylla melanoneura TaxID=428564 RepID=A0A8D8ZTY1_9HEMI